MAQATIDVFRDADEIGRIRITAPPHDPPGPEDPPSTVDPRVVTLDLDAIATAFRLDVDALRDWVDAALAE